MVLKLLFWLMAIWMAATAMPDSEQEVAASRDGDVAVRRQLRDLRDFICRRQPALSICSEGGRAADDATTTTTRPRSFDVAQRRAAAVATETSGRNLSPNGPTSPLATFGEETPQRTTVTTSTTTTTTTAPTSTKTATTVVNEVSEDEFALGDEKTTTEIIEAEETNITTTTETPQNSTVTERPVIQIRPALTTRQHALDGLSPLRSGLPADSTQREYENALRQYYEARRRYYELYPQASLYYPQSQQYSPAQQQYSPNQQYSSTASPPTATQQRYYYYQQPYQQQQQYQYYQQPSYSSGSYIPYGGGSNRAVNFDIGTNLMIPFAGPIGISSGFGFGGKK